MTILHPNNLENNLYKIEENKPIFPGLSQEAINFLYEYGDWEPISNIPEVAGLPDKAFVYIVDADTKSVGFYILDNKQTLFGTLKTIIRHPFTDEPSFPLRIYDLKDGAKAEESIQGMICGYFLLCLDIADGSTIFWSDEDILKIGGECGATELTDSFE